MILDIDSIRLTLDMADFFPPPGGKSGAPMQSDVSVLIGITPTVQWVGALVYFLLYRWLKRSISVLLGSRSHQVPGGQ